VIRLSPLRRKLWRDLRRLWAQALAIALVMAAGVATLVLGVGAVASLEQTRAAYYEANRFADVFAGATRAPRALLPRIEEIDGVLGAEARNVELALLDMPGMAEPGRLLLVSAPGEGAGGLNRLHLRQGRLPEAGRAGEAAVSQGFATAHGLRPGSRLGVLVNGRMRELTVTGIAISPEFIYAIGPGDILPDPRRYGIVWMPDTALAPLVGRAGAFNDLVVDLVPGASEAAAIAAIDAILAPYGGTGAVGRDDQLSHAFLDAELAVLRGMSRGLPPVFLLVSAFLVNMTLARLVALEREQIGLLKALGYGSWAIARHYVEFALAIALLGIAIGWAAGAWLGAELAGLYARFFDFPFLIFSRSPDSYAVAALVTLAAAVAGAAGAVRGVAWLPPAAAMSPPAPPLYRRLGLRAAARLAGAGQRGAMVARHLLHRPLRTGGGILGTALAVAVLVGSLWSLGSIERVVDVTFFRAERHDIALTFAAPRPLAAMSEVRALPGVLRAESRRSLAVRLSAGHVGRRVALVGVPADAALSVVLSPAAEPIALPAEGLVLSTTLAELLGVGPGDIVTVEVLTGDRRILSARVAGLGLGYLGLGATVRLEALNRMLGEGAVIDGARIDIDPAAEDAFYAAVKATPGAGVVTVQRLALASFRATLAQNIIVMILVYVALAAIVAFGVVYNFARITLSEQGRELASLRVLGFTRAEAAGILDAEIAVVALVAQPLGWLIGTGVAALVAWGLSSELFTLPLVLGPWVYATASLVVLAAAAASALLVRRRIARLDMIAVLKTRE
jgi:putative ABC transport system permease protein